MKNTHTRLVRFVFISTLILIITASLRRFNFFLPGEDAQFFSNILSGIIYGGAILLWGKKVCKMIVQEKIRTYMVMMIGLMVTLVIFRTLRFVTVNPEVQRIWWYCYFIPILELPLLGYKISCFLGQDDNYEQPTRNLIWDGISGIMIIYALTNDIHELVYKIEDMNVSEGVYRHQYGYYVIVAWIAILCMHTLYNVLRKSRTSFTRYYYIYPLGIFFLGGGYTVYYLLFHAVYETEPLLEIGAVACWLYILMWETMITMGLIPNNQDYQLFFNESSLSAYITDEQGEILYLSKGAEAVSKVDFEELKDCDELKISEYKEAHIYQLQDGYVVYVNDMTGVVEMIEDLEDVRENLKGEQLLLQKITEAEAAKVHIEEKERLFKKMSEASSKQVTEIRALMQEIRTKGENKASWGKILILGTYLKRYSNLLLIAESDHFTTSLELKLSLQQSLENLKLYGPKVGMLIQEDKQVEVAWIMRCYALFEAIVEYYLDNLESIHVMFSQKNEKNVYLIEAEYRGEMNPFEFAEEIPGTLQLEEDEDTIRACFKWDNLSGDSTQNRGAEA